MCGTCHALPSARSPPDRDDRSRAVAVAVGVEYPSTSRGIREKEQQGCLAVPTQTLSALWPGPSTERIGPPGRCWVGLSLKVRSTSSKEFPMLSGNYRRNKLLRLLGVILVLFAVASPVVADEGCWGYCQAFCEGNCAASGGECDGGTEEHRWVAAASRVHTALGRTP